jgi:hypothetical protein
LLSGTCKIDPHPRQPEVGDMSVCVDQPRYHRGIPDVDPRRTRVACQQLFPIADADDPALGIERQRVGDRPRRVHGVDPAPR